MPTVLAVTDLGGNNKGRIGAGDLNPDEKQRIVEDVANPEYHRRPTNRVRCVDMRIPEGGFQHPEGHADIQVAGGPPIFGAAVDMMVVEQTSPLSALVVKNTREALAADVTPIVHDDCGANKNLRATLRSNAENIDIVAPKAWAFSKELGLQQWIDEDDVTQLIVTGNKSANDDSLWDITPDEATDISEQNGAIRHRLQGKHNEKAVVIELSGGTFAQEEFMRDHPRPDGESNGVFVASLRAYMPKEFEKVRSQGGTDRDAALRMAGVILFNIGVPKEIGDDLPVIVLK